MLRTLTNPSTNPDRCRVTLLMHAGSQTAVNYLDRTADQRLKATGKFYSSLPPPRRHITPTSSHRTSSPLRHCSSVWASLGGYLSPARRASPMMIPLVLSDPSTGSVERRHLATSRRGVRGNADKWRHCRPVDGDTYSARNCRVDYH